MSSCIYILHIIPSAHSYDRARKTSLCADFDYTIWNIWNCSALIIWSNSNFLKIENSMPITSRDFMLSSANHTRNQYFVNLYIITNPLGHRFNQQWLKLYSCLLSRTCMHTRIFLPSVLAYIKQVASTSVAPTQWIAISSSYTLHKHRLDSILFCVCGVADRYFFDSMWCRIWNDQMRT